MDGLRRAKSNHFGSQLAILSGEYQRIEGESFGLAVNEKLEAVRQQRLKHKRDFLRLWRIFRFGGNVESSRLNPPESWNGWMRYAVIINSVTGMLVMVIPPAIGRINIMPTLAGLMEATSNFGWVTDCAPRIGETFIIPTTKGPATVISAAAASISFLPAFSLCLV
ncbi:MAG TPA: hypothetical protein VHZ07_19415 [Bryobacteraceae bacterium]|jgi:hypothetical protein|nr:hypothetical protein [Bryobacteraceae bacterium]